MDIEIAELDRRYADCRIADAHRQGQLVASLSRDGQQSPVIVVPSDNEAERYVLIDGYGRAAALETLVRDVVQAAVLDMSASDALIRHRLDAGRRASALEEAWLLSMLVKEHGVKQAKIALMLGRSTSWVSRRLSLLDVLPQSVRLTVQQGKLGAQVASKYLVPLARANTQQCETLVSNLKTAPTVRQMSQLYERWCRGDLEQRERIVESPDLFLRVIAPRDTPSLDVVKPLVEDLRIVASVSARATRRLDDGLISDVGAASTRRMARHFHAAKESFETLSSYFIEERRDAGA